MNNILSVNNLCVSFNHELIIDHCSFNLPQGSVGLILGQNGIGKTTLLNVIGGLHKDYTGQVINRSQKMSYLKQMSHQDESSFFGTVQEIIRLGSKRPGKKVMTQNEVLKIIASVGLSEVKNHLYDELSGGQQERVKIGMMMASKPDLALLDEPTAGLDKEGKRWLNQCLKELNKQGTTLLIVTHEEEIFNYADWSLHFKEEQGVLSYEVWDGETDVIV